MHVVIINGSPRSRELSNTHKILLSFIKGIEKENVTYELYSLSNHQEWDSAREAFLTNDKIIFALPMYVDSIPSLMLEFLESLQPQDLSTSGVSGSIPTGVNGSLPTGVNGSLPTGVSGSLPLREGGGRVLRVLSFILHGGFDEGYQFRLCEKLLKSITAQLGCNYGGCLIKGGSFMLRLFEYDKVERMTSQYIRMGVLYARHGHFVTPEAKRFTGPERYPWLVRQIAAIFLKLVINKKFKQFAQDWGCCVPLDYKP